MQARRRGAVSVAICLLLVTLLLPAAVVGNHTHTIGEWVHGMTDATDSDYYLHPFNTNKNNHEHYNRVQIALDYYVLYNFICPCTHNHFDWDTSPTPECKYESENTTQAIRTC